MSLRVEQDLNRFREIVRGRIRRNLRKYMSQGELIGRVGKDLVSIPIPQIDIPSFRYGENENGVGQGDGDEGHGGAVLGHRETRVESAVVGKRRGFAVSGERNSDQAAAGPVRRSSHG